MDAPIYIINLSDATERWESSVAEMDRLGMKYERFPAVDGRTLLGVRGKHQDRGNFFRFAYELTPTEIGCFLSHLRLWERIAERHPEGAFIMEDDFSAAAFLTDTIAAINDEQIRGPVMIKLFDGGNEPDVLHTRALAQGIDLVIPYAVPYTTVAYYVSRCAAEKLVKKCRSEKFRKPVDDFLRHRWETGVRVWVVKPSPVRLTANHLQTSAIAPERRLIRRSEIDKFRMRMYWRYIRNMNRLYVAAVRVGFLRWVL